MTTATRWWGAASTAALLALAGCNGGGGSDEDENDTEPTRVDGGDDDDDDDDDADDGPEPAPEIEGIGISGLRRLSRNEYDNTVRDILGDDTRPAQALPEDVVDPFDNAFEGQIATRTLIESLESVAIDVAGRLIEDPVRRDMVVGCTPTGPTDDGCMESFVESFGRLALRRPLTGAEITDFTAHGMSWIDDDFYEGVDSVVRLLLQHPEFVYRVELGVPTEDNEIFRLTDFEVATRLSYFIWGSTPDDWLLTLAEDGGLTDPEDVRDAAETMLTDDRALGRVDRFHAMWLGFYTLPHEPELTNSMRLETQALLENNIFVNEGSWLDIFLADGTYANDFLAVHYGLTPPGSEEFVWVDYADSGRQGLLSHGSFLSVVGKFGDTSPTLRGKLIRERLMCQVIPPPPPDVNVDEPPQGEAGDCKYDRYEAHRSVGSCNACHELVDPIGFGLENYDQAGQYRVSDNGAPECIIEGEGDIDGELFNGPAGLADLLVQNGTLEECIVQQVYQFAMGHSPGPDDQRYVEDMALAFSEGEYRFKELVLALAEDEAFLYRRAEEVE